MNLQNITVRASGIYPEIVEATDDPQTVAILKDLAFSRESELSAILTYMYQSTIADKTDPDIGKVFEEIGMVEMTHLSLLMHAITSFGGVPKYENSNGVPFNTNYINYTTKLKEMLENNIRGEQNGINNYNHAIRMFKNQSLKDLIARIIQDEQKHVETLKYIRDNVNFLSY